MVESSVGMRAVRRAELLVENLAAPMVGLRAGYSAGKTAVQ